MSDEIDAPVGVTEESFDLLEWIESGTVGRREVTIYNNPGLYSEYLKLEERLDELGYYADDEEHTAATADDTLGDGHGTEVEQILAQMSDLYDRWQDSKSTWTVRAISREEVEDSFDKHPDPKSPIPPRDNAGKAERDAFVEAVASFGRDKDKAERERQLLQLATCIIEIRTTRGTKDGVSVDELRALRSRPHGEQWLGLLYEALGAATEVDVEIPRPTSNGRSATSQD